MIEGNPAARNVSTRPIEQDVFSPPMLEGVIKWLNECLEGKARSKRIHERCPRPIANFLPRRLIEKTSCSGEAHRLRLIETDSLPKTTYIALSYCWGRDQLLKTTKDLLSSWMTEIPWEQLPATLKDAVLTCSRLSVQHIWIDAFCIVQNDPDDMAIEIARMPMIYQNSILTLAVARAASVKEGTRFFCQHNPRGFTNGWTLRPENSDSRTDSLQDIQVLHANFNEARGQPVEGYSLQFEETMNNWLKPVEVYTHRYLTVPTDRIVAISGVAER